MNKKAEGGFIFLAGILLFIPIFVAWAFSIVPYNDYAFEREFGHLKMDMKTEGINYIGIGSLVEVNNQNRVIEFKAESFSKDLQQINILTNVNMKLKKEKAYEYILNYQTEEAYQSFLESQIQQRIKLVTIEYNAEQFIFNRTMIADKIEKAIREIPELDYFQINIVTLKDIVYSKDFQDAIEKKAQLEIEKGFLLKQKENLEIANDNMKLVDMDKYFKYRIAEKWDGKSALTIVGGGN
jgi:regulator of protease activity HflC (stomatin/prohibitin superfamily)